MVVLAYWPSLTPSSVHSAVVLRKLGVRRLWRAFAVLAAAYPAVALAQFEGSVRGTVTSAGHGAILGARVATELEYGHGSDGLASSSGGRGR